MDNPQARFDSVIVGGTNGKGTVSYLLAELLRAAGFSRGALYVAAFAHGARADMR